MKKVWFLPNATSNPIPAPIVVSVVQGLEHRVVAPEIQVRVLSLAPRKVNAKPSAKEKSNGEQYMNEDIANILGLVIENMNENYQLPDPNLLIHYEN